MLAILYASDLRNVSTYSSTAPRGPPRTLVPGDSEERTLARTIKDLRPCEILCAYSTRSNGTDVRRTLGGTRSTPPKFAIHDVYYFPVYPPDLPRVSANEELSSKNSLDNHRRNSI